MRNKPAHERDDLQALMNDIGSSLVLG